MHPSHIRAEALRLHAEGVPFTEIYRRLGISRNTVASWLYHRHSIPIKIDNRCPHCTRPSRPIDDPRAYAYLLGQYLGDGHLLMTRRVPLLMIACDSRYPGLIHEVSHAMTACGAKTTGYQERPGCINVRAHWKHWPCLFPQYGAGPKHLRRIELAAWQREVTGDQPEQFLRGLFHSDGSRFTNRIVRNGKIYCYARYMFVNKSVDIMRLCQSALDQAGVAWRMARPDSLSVARRADVARLDGFIGPKW